MIIFNKHIDFWIIKFPMYLPVIYCTLLLLYPEFSSTIALFTLILLAEPHFGATWPFLLDRVNKAKIIQEKVIYIYVPILIILLSTYLFIFNFTLLFFIFFIVNIFHVTRQSTGISSLYLKSDKLHFQKKLIYIANFYFFLIGFFRFYTDIPLFESILVLSLTSLLFLIILIIVYLYYYRYSENIFILITGMTIFYPMSFVSEPIHGIIMGVTMHYIQYLALTYKITSKRKINITREPKKLNLNFLGIVISYGLIMALLSTFSTADNDIYRNLILIPFLGQLLHFYYDSFLWKFNDQHHKDNTLNLLRE